MDRTADKTAVPQFTSATALTIHWSLRLAAAGCFIGHGAFGIRLKEAWLVYFNAMGFSDAIGYRLMPIVGTVDILMGISMLLCPIRVVLLWMSFWALFTAHLRPLAGESWWEVLERAGNYGVPMAFLALSGWARSWREWFEPIAPRAALEVSRERLDRVATFLRWTIGLLLIGHGGFGAFVKKAMLQGHYAAVGLDALPIGLSTLGQIFGWMEILLGVWIIVGRFPLGLLWFVFVWKVATEFLYPISGSPMWEFIERAGDYGAPVALFAILSARRALAPRRSALAPVAALVLAVSGVACSTSAIAISGGGAIVAIETSPPAPVDTAATLSDSAAGPPDSAAAKAAREFPRPEPELVKALREGGYVIVFRHSLTDWAQRDTDGEHFENRAAQRNLSKEGEAQAAAIGKAIEALDVPIGSVLSSPMWRCRDTARLAFGREESTVDLFRRGGPYREARLKMLSTPPPAGTITVLVTHQDVLIPIIAGLKREQLKEGEAFVVRPLGERKFEVVAQVSLDDWARLGKGQAR